MSLEIKIPAVGESITSGLLSIWHKNDGDAVTAGEALFTLETDKVSTEITAEKAGTLRIQVAAGSEVKIGEVVGAIEEGTATKPEAAQTPDDKSDGRTTRAKVEPPAAVMPKTPSVSLAAAAPAAAPKTETAAPAPSIASGSPTDQPPLVPGAAASAVEEANQSLGSPTDRPPLVPGTASSAVVSESLAPVTEGRSTRKKLSPLRRKIAVQLVMAQHTAAILTTFNEAEMSAVMKLRAEQQEAFTKEHGVKLGFMSFFIKAVVSALKAVPSVNGRMEGDDFIQNNYYDVGVAVGTERGLIVPVVRDADQKSFAQVERDLADYAKKARDGKIKIEDLSGGVFTISNGGIYGSLLSTPILNPPQSGILGMHKIQERPIAEKGQVVICPMMYLALSYDHRVVDGKEAVTFLVRVKDCIENPVRLMLDL